MVAATQFAGLVKTAIEEGIDLVVAGAGFQEICSQWQRVWYPYCTNCFVRKISPHF